jgi:hypothetical protein
VTPDNAPVRKPSFARRLKWPLIVIVVAAALYLGSPYYAFWRFTQALKAGDQQRFEKMVDFRSVRESLKKQLRAKLAETRAKDPKPAEQPKRETPLLALSDQFAPRLIDTLVDAYVTPAGLAALLADVKSVEAGGAAGERDPNAPADPRDASAITESEAVRERLGWKSVRYAFFTGPRDFLLDVDGTKLRFRFSKFRWILKTVEPELGDIPL